MAATLRPRLRAEPCDAMTLARAAEIWLEPTAGADTVRRRRVICFDPARPGAAAEVARATVDLLLRLEGFDEGCDDAELDEIATALIAPHAKALRALSAS